MSAIGVAISTRDRPGALARCLEALLAGERVPDEVVVVDQSRGDATREVADAFLARGLRVAYRRQDARGLGVAQNAAVAAATAPIVAVTDDDCIPDRRWLAVIEGAFREAPELGGVTGRVLPAEAQGERRYPVALRVETRRRDFVGRQAPWHVGSGNNFAVRRDDYLRIGGCDERLGPGSPGRGGVDMDLFYRLLRAGVRIRYVPESVVLHERQTWAERLERAPMYGHGMGACCILWMRQGDWYGARLLAEWVWLRFACVVGPRGEERLRAAREELAAMRGTLQGVAYGLRAGGTAHPPAPVPREAAVGR